MTSLLAIVGLYPICLGLIVAIDYATGWNLGDALGKPRP